VGAVSSSRLVKDDVEELFDYATLRRGDEATMFVVTVARPLIVLGSSQARDVLDSDRLGDTPLRRRKGGGGLVLLRPDDLWIDWWIPHDDDRWSHDLHVSSAMAGGWWAEALRKVTSEPVSVYEGPLEGDLEFRVVCFAGRGPGEVFVADRKAVGLTQWRVREGVLLSTVVHAQPTSDVLAYLAHVPEGLSDALNHQVLSSLNLERPDELVDDLASKSRPSRRQSLLLSI
jgi:lipoate-protein ligase A